MNQERIGKFIYNLRKSNNLTQAELANKLGVTYQAVSKWENGKNIPDIAIMQQISNEFNVDITEIINGERTNKKRLPLLIIIAIILIVIIALIFIVVITTNNHHNDFIFKTLYSNCETFNISGAIAYNKEKASLYISNIEYCGELDDNLYKSIVLGLYKEKNNIITKLKENGKDFKEGIKIADYIKTVRFEVNDYLLNCNDFTNENIYIEVEASTDVNQIIKYRIPLKFNDVCPN